jgi:hypothetical protein
MQHRYAVRSTGNPDRFCVWDTHHDAIVFGTRDVTERQAKEMAERLNDSYQRSKVGE